MIHCRLLLSMKKISIGFWLVFVRSKLLSLISIAVFLFLFLFYMFLMLNRLSER